jgi:hypothetical protein
MVWPRFLYLCCRAGSVSIGLIKKERPSPVLHPNLFLSFHHQGSTTLKSPSFLSQASQQSPRREPWRGTPHRCCAASSVAPPAPPHRAEAAAPGRRTLYSWALPRYYRTRKIPASRFMLSFRGLITEHGSQLRWPPRSWTRCWPRQAPRSPGSR